MTRSRLPSPAAFDWAPPLSRPVGCVEAEMKEIVGLVDRVLQHRQDPAVLEEVRAQAKALCGRFPIFHPTKPRQIGAGSPPVKCPFCDELEDKVVDSRMAKEGEVIRRRRECLGCKRRYTTYERVEEILPMVVKKDGRRESFDRTKILVRPQKSLRKTADQYRHHRSRDGSDRETHPGDGRNRNRESDRRGRSS